MRGGSARKSEPLPFYIPFLTEKVPLSQMVIPLQTNLELYMSLTAVNTLSMNKSQNLEYKPRSF